MLSANEAEASGSAESNAAVVANAPILWLVAAQLAAAGARVRSLPVTGRNPTNRSLDTNRKTVNGPTSPSDTRNRLLVEVPLPVNLPSPTPALLPRTSMNPRSVDPTNL